MGPAALDGTHSPTPGCAWGHCGEAPSQGQAWHRGAPGHQSNPAVRDHIPIPPHCHHGVKYQHGGLETNPPVGQNPQTLCPQHFHLQAAWTATKLSREQRPRGPHNKQHQNTPGVGSASQSLIPAPEPSPRYPPRAPPSRAGHAGRPHLTRGSRRRVSAGASAAPHGRGTGGAAAGSGDSWADRATLKIAQECEGPAGRSSSSRRESRGGTLGPRHQQHRHRHRCQRK